MRSFDRPLWKDWVFWLGVLGVAAATRTSATVVDALIDGALGWILWGLVPAEIRRDESFVTSR